MDAINQAVASAKSALGYGDATTTTATNQTAGREPISGEQGAGTATEPYDKGNETTATTTTYTGSSQDTSSYQPSTTTTTTTNTSDTTALPSHIKSNPSDSNIPSSSSNPTTMSSSTPSQPGMNNSSISSDTQAAGTSSAATNMPLSTGAPAGQSRPSAGERAGDVRPTEANENRPGQNVGGFGTVEPSVNADPKSAQKPKTAQEGADRPLDEPDRKETAAIKSDKAEVEGEQKGQSSSQSQGQGGHHPISDEEREKLAAKGELPHDPNDHSGEPMHMHGGGSDDPKKEEKSEGGVTEKQRKASIGQEGGNPHGSAKGTGEEYVKSSGLAADGGDFDAAKPGAGKEATRLMEEKGMKKDGGPASSGGSAVGHDSTHSDSKDGKPSMMQKLKDKMNPGTGSGLD